MKILPGENGKASGLTLFEVLVVIALVIILAAFLLPAHVGGGKSPRFTCMNHLKEIDLGLFIYADDFAGHFPMRVPATNAGATAFIYSRYAFPALKKLSAYRIHPAYFVCPLDINRQAATNIQTLTDLNISYFLNADASHTNNPTQTLIAGDRNLSANGKSVNHGLFVMTTNFDMSWTHEIHAIGGNLAFADGHVEWVSANRLNAVVQRQLLATNRLVVP